MSPTPPLQREMAMCSPQWPAIPTPLGYVSFTYIDETVKALTVEGVEATDANVKNSTYKISRPFLIFWHEENMNEVAKAFVEFMMSAEGQAIVAEKAIPVTD
ncbi:MAG: hypothetical protein ACLR23_22630 [Clostridia bacterium]